MGEADHPKTFGELVTDFAQRVRKDTSYGVSETMAKRYLNTALLDLHMGHGEKFPWAERRATLLTHPTYAEGTVTLNPGSAVISGSGGMDYQADNDFGQENVRRGGKVVYGQDTEVYEVHVTLRGAPRPPSENLTLTTAYIGEAATGVSYLYFEDEYDLPSDFLRPLDLRNFSDGYPLSIIDRREFRRRYLRNNGPGRPEVCAIVQLTHDDPPFSEATPRKRLAIHPPPLRAIEIPYAYVTSNHVVSEAGALQESMSADADEPMMPYRYRQGITLKALHIWYRDRLDDGRSQSAESEFQRWVSRMLGDHEIGTNRAMVRPVTRFYKRRTRSPFTRGRDPRYDVGGKFDRMET